MSTKTLLLPCIYVYRFFHYFLLGLKYMPSILLSIFPKKNKVASKAPKQNSSKVEAIGNTVINTSKKIKEKADEKVLSAKEQKFLDRPEFKVNFNGEEAEKHDKKVTYRYEVADENGKPLIGYFDAFSVVEVNSYLLSEGYKVFDIRTSKYIQMFHSAKELNQSRIKNKDLIFMIAQLSTYLKVGIPLADAVNKLTKQFKNPAHQKVLKAIKYDLSIGRSFSEALDKQGKAFPRLFINMVQTAEMTGELPETLDDMEEYYTEMESTRKAMISAMMYPTIVFVIAIGVGLFIMLFVVPKFVDIYNSMDNATLPWITKMVLGLSEFLNNYVIIVGIGVIVLILFLSYLYRNVRGFRRSIQLIGMHLPVFKNVIIYNEVTTFTKTFASLLSNNVFITDSMDILHKITNNEIYKEMIDEAVLNVAKGGKISTAFKDKWAFPIPAYEMIVTGEETGQLAEMMDKVSQYYQDLHKNSVARIKSFVEPAMIIMLTVMVGVIVLAIVVPMFNMYSAIQQ